MIKSISFVQELEALSSPLVSVIRCFVSAVKSYERYNLF